MRGLCRALILAEYGNGNMDMRHNEDDYKHREKDYERKEYEPKSHKDMSDKKTHAQKMKRETAEEWTEKMENEDGTKGAHWSYDQVNQLMAQKNIDCDPAEFYAAVNMMYSDYCKVAKQYNINTVDFYFAMAKAFLDDADAGDDKIEKYYEYVVDDD